MKSIAIVVPSRHVDIQSFIACVESWKEIFNVSIISVSMGAILLNDGHEVMSSNTIAQIDDLSFDGIAVMGGSGSKESLWDNPPLIAKLQCFDKARKLVAGIGTGGMTLAQAGLLVGKKATTLDDINSIADLRSYGAIYDKDDVVAVTWIITGNGRDAQGFAEAVKDFMTAY